MWPFTKKQSDLVTLYLTPQHITCCFIEQPSHKNTRPRISLYERHTLKHLEFAQALIFNPTHLKTLITNFISRTGRTYPPVALALSGPRIFEHIVQSTQATTQNASFDIADLATMTWESCYLCPSQKGGFDFFVCGMKPEYLLTYQLFAYAANLNLTTITTGSHAQLHAYKHAHGESFRQSQLSLDLLANKYDTAGLYSAASLTRIVDIDPALALDVDKELLPLGTHIGLFLSEERR